MTTNSKRDVSLYIHFPFCVKKCAYCAFFSAPCKSEELKDEYERAVIRRIDSLPGINLKTVYFGGGTPTVMGSARLRRIIESIFKKYEISANTEITLEANPGTVTAEDLYELRGTGFNRLSLGMQSANDVTLGIMGRVHDNATFLQCYSDARRCFDNISLDAIFGVPGDDFTATVKQMTELEPEHVSAYSLTLEEGTPMYDDRERFVFPDENEEYAQYETLCGELRAHGYDHYEISSFAKPGYRSVHNSSYWRRGEYIGIGPGAHSFYLSRRFETPKDTLRFIKRSILPFLSDTDYETALPLSAEESEEERIMLGLRLADGVKLPKDKTEKAKKFAESGFGTFKDGVFALNETGFRVSNAIIAELI
ncbi:MAG: radical SAM family heme chaperone HemW [Clostridia bacterium]|nr:radical SAM family heme chaperone HemW [Clostridia bacterium]